MFSYKEKIKFAVFLLLGALGFATGINYSLSLSSDSISTIKGCFEFGIYPLLEGRNNIKIFFNAFLSSVKHYLLFLSGVFSWILFPLVPINLFCVCFKIGVSVEYIFSTIGIKGLLSNVFLFAYFLLIILVAVIFSYLIFNRRLSHIKQSKTDYQDILFIKNTAISLVVLIILQIAVLFCFKFTGSTLFGLLNTFL